MGERLIRKQIESCALGALQARSEERLNPIRAAFICSNACDIIAEDAYSFATQHSIGLIDIK